MDQTTPPAGGDQDRGPEAVAIMGTLLALSLVILSLRFWARHMIHKTGADDWMMLLTVIFLIIATGFMVREAQLGGFRHLFYLSPDERVSVLRLSWIGQPYLMLGFAAGKISVGLLLLRILGPNTVWRKWILIAAVGSAFVFTIVNISLTYAQCTPVEALWNPALVASGQGTCWNSRVQADFAIFLGAWNSFVDMLLAVIPVSIIWAINMPWYRKVGLCVLLGLGFVAAICSAIKTQFLASLTARSDFTWETYNLYVWSEAELFVIVVCGSIPPLKPIYDRCFGGESAPKTKSFAGYHEYAISMGRTFKSRHRVSASSSELCRLPRNQFSPDLEKAPQELPGEEPYKPQKEHPAGDITVPMPGKPPLKPTGAVAKPANGGAKPANVGTNQWI